MRGQPGSEFPRHFSFRCDAETGALIDACLDPALPASIGLRELLSIGEVRDALSRRASALAAQRLLRDLRR